MKKTLSFILSGVYRVAFRPTRIHQIFKNFFLDIKYAGAYLGIPLYNENKSEGFTNTTSSEYDILTELFQKLKISRDDVIVDVGCGNGRVLGWLTANYPQNQVIGIEIDPNVAASTKKRMRKYCHVEVIVGNCLDKDTMQKGTVFYLFHPFHEQSMRKFAALLKERGNLDQFVDQRPLIVYHNCHCLNVFEEDPVWKIERCGNMNGLPTAILTLCME